MILVVSPAKTLDFSETKNGSYTQPRMLSQSSELVNQLKGKSIENLKKLMSISDQLAELNAKRFENFTVPFTKENAKQSVLAFNGDVYAGLEAEDFDESDLEFAQKHLRILSGLYGVLRPLDLMQPYRLEMGTKMKTKSGKNLYEFWGDQITEFINDDLKALDSEALVNLASKEYFSAIKPAALKGDIYEVQFKENKNGKYKVIAFYAKKARGMMCHFAIKHRLTQPEQLKAFSEDNYIYNEELSEDKKLVFTR